MNWKATSAMAALACVLALLGERAGADGQCDRCLPMPDLPGTTMSSTSLSLPYQKPPAPDQWKNLTGEQRLADVRSRLLPKLNDELAAKGAKLGAASFIRVFKESKELELWLRTGRNWTLFRTYPIAVFSGNPGPKTREGDRQAPEGFYGVSAGKLNPNSKYHLSFDIGYPNAYDRHHERTGSLIMIHGDEVSIGCFAMTDPVIEEIYLIVEAALKAVQKEVPMHVFPFRMTEGRLAEVADSPWITFWRELQKGYDWFEAKREPPTTKVEKGRHVFEAAGAL